VHTLRTRPCVSAIYTTHTCLCLCTRAVSTAVYGTDVYMCTRPCTRLVHGRAHGRDTARTRRVRSVHSRVHDSVHVHGLYTATDTVRAHSRVHDHVDGRILDRVHGCIRTVYMARTRPRTRLVHGRVHICTARIRNL